MLYDVVGYEGHYQFDENGNVYSLKNGRVKKLKPRITHDGYVWYSLSKDGKAKTIRINRIIATALIPNPENKLTVNHKDGNKLNNTLSNLEWATREEQIQHAYNLNLKQPMKGTLSGRALLTEEQVIEIRSIYKAKSKEFGMQALAKKYNVSCPTILRCVRKRSYDNIE